MDVHKTKGLAKAYIF